MKCADVDPRLAACIRGDLAADEDAAVRTHLLECPSCRSRHDALEHAWRRLDDLVVGDPNASPAVLRGIRRLAAASDGVPGMDPVRTRRIPVPVLAAAATLVLGFVAGRTLPSSRDTSPVVEARLEALEQQVLAARLGSDDVIVRLSAIDASTVDGTAGPSVTDALLRALAEDPSVNVRLAAVEALGPALAERDVALRAARLLAAEPSVLVQLALTERLARLEDSALRGTVLRQISRDALQPDARQRLEELVGGRT